MNDYLKRLIILLPDGNLTLLEIDKEDNRRTEDHKVTEEEASRMASSFIKSGFEELEES